MAMKLVLVLRTDLDMGRGKIAAQAAHGAVAAALRTSGTADFESWLREGQPKVVLKARSEDQLLDIYAAGQNAGLPVELIQDAGRTQVEGGTATCVAIGPAPAEQIDPVTGALSLL